MSFLDGSLPGSSTTTPNTFVQTPDQIARTRALAQILAQEGSSTAPIQSPWQGAAHLVQALGGAVGNWRANQAQNLATADAAAQTGNAYNWDPGQQQNVPDTPGQTTPALQQSDAINDATADNQTAGMSQNAALAAAIAASRGGGQSAGAASAGAAGPPNSSNPAPSAGSTPGGSGLDPQAVTAYLAQAAQQRGIDPRVATAMLGGESGYGTAYVGDQGSSFGPLQLHYGNIAPGVLSHPGLGDAFTAATGLDARDPATWQQQINFALDQAKTGGWSPWATTRDKLGFSNFTGIGSGAAASPSAYAGPSAAATAPAPAAISAASPATGAPPTWAQVQADNAAGMQTINSTPTPVAPSVGTMSGRPPPPADHFGQLNAAMQGQANRSEWGMRGTESANAAPASPAPSQGDLSQLATAMQPWASKVQPQGFGGDHLSANAAEVTNPPDPRLALAAALSAPTPPASPPPNQAALAAAIAAHGDGSDGPPAPVNSALVTALGGVPMPPPRPADLGDRSPAPGAPMQLPGASWGLDTATAPGASVPPQQAAVAGGSPALPPQASSPPPPNTQALMTLIGNPWVPQEQKQLAMQILAAQMPAAPTWGVISEGNDGSKQYGLIYTKSPTGPHVTDANGNPVTPGQGGYNISSSPGGGPTPQGAGAPQASGNGAKIPNLPPIGLTPEGGAWLSSVAQGGGKEAITARRAMAIINGQAQLPDGGGMGPTKANDIAVIDAVFKAAPGYNASLAASRAKAISEFQDKSASASRGGLAQNMNAAIGHLADLSDLSEALPTNSDSTFLPNSAVNATKSAFMQGPNAASISAYNQAKAVVSEEVTKFYQGGPGTEGERDALIAKLSPDASPSERRAGIAAISKLIQTKGTELQADWHQATGAPDGAQYDYPIYHAPALDGIARIAQRAAPGFGVAPASPAPAAPGSPAPATPAPPAPGARRAPDGLWYVPDPARPGKYLQVN
jgi:hypothetical protein